MWNQKDNDDDNDAEAVTDRRLGHSFRFCFFFCTGGISLLIASRDGARGSQLVTRILGNLHQQIARAAAGAKVSINNSPVHQISRWSKSCHHALEASRRRQNANWNRQIRG